MAEITHLNTSLNRRRVAVTLSAHVSEVRPGVYVAVVQDAQARLLWQSVPVLSYSVAEYLGWFHMALLATRLQEDGADVDDE